MIFPRRVRAGTRLVLLAAFALIAALALPGAAAVADGPPGVFCSDTGSASQRTQVHGAWTFSPNCFAMGGPGLTYTVTAGAATPNGFGQVVYTPSADNVGDDQFTVRADNGQGGTASATIFLHVSPPGPPMCQQPDAALSARPGRQVATMPNCVMNGPQNEDLGFVFVSPPVDGKAWVNQYGALVYRGAHNGDESFTVRPVGSQTGQGDPIIVTVHTGDDLNSPPSCSGFGGFGAIARAGVPTPIAAGCSDSDGDPMSVSVDPANPAAHRAISDLVTRNNNDLLGRDAGPGFTYTAPADAADSSDDFKVLVDDGHGGITPVSFHVQILSPSTNHAPSCFGGSELTITPGQTSSLAMFCSDGDGDPVDVSVKAGHGPSLGGLEPDNYSFVGLAYTAGSATGDDSFTLTADDHHGGVVDIPAVVHVVAPSKPTCTRSTEETSVRSGKSTGVGFGFSCDANGPISIQPIGTPSSGTLTPVTFSGQLFAYDYRADAGISAPTDVTLQFKAVNGGVESDVLTTTVHVDPAFNTPPDCFVESGQPAAGAFVGSSLPVRAGTSRTLSFDCFDAEGDRATLTASAGHGSAPVKTDSTEIGADGWRETRGSILYTPSAGYVGADKVTLTADDGHPGGSSTASNRLAVEDAAADSEPSCMVSAPNTQTGSKSRVVLSCSDDDNDTLTLATTGAGTSPLTNGGLSELTPRNTGDPGFSQWQAVYTPPAEFIGFDPAQVVVSDGILSQTLRLTMQAVPVNNHPPVCTNSTQDTNNLHAIGATVDDLCSDRDGDLLAGQIVDGPTRGAVTGPSADGTYLYTPNAGFVGTDHLTYRAVDPLGMASMVKTITVNVSAAEPTTSTAEAGDTVSTGGAGTTPSPTVPVLASVTTPGAGTVTITEQPPGDATAGYQLFGRQFTIQAPDATAGQPLKLVFSLDGSALPSGITYRNVVVVRNGSEITPCSGSTDPADATSDDVYTTANPDPCVARRQSLADGGARLVILSSHASVWAFGKALPASTTTASTTTTTTTTTPAGTTSKPPASGPVTPAVDRTPPTLTLGKLGKTIKLKVLLQKGLMLTPKCSETCIVSASFVLDGKTAKKLHLTNKKVKSVAVGSVRGEGKTVTLRLSKKAAKAFKRLRSVKLTLVVSATDAAGNNSKAMQVKLNIKR